MENLQTENRENENPKIRAIKKSSGVTATVLNVFKIICLVAAICALVGGISCLAAGDQIDSRLLYDGEHVDVYAPGFDAAEVFDGGFDFLQDLPIEKPSTLAALNCFTAAVVLIGVMVILIIVRRTFLEIRDSDTPFTESIRRRIRTAGILVTILVAIDSVGAAAIVALTIWCAYTIFGYGMELQKRDDETL